MKSSEWKLKKYLERKEKDKSAPKKPQNALMDFLNSKEWTESLSRAVKQSAGGF